MDEHPISIIRRNYNSLSRCQKKIADYVLGNKETASEISINKMAQECGLSETTILRFLKKLGYDSYKVFKVSLIKELSANKAAESDRGRFFEKVSDYADISENDIFDEVVKKAIGSTTRALSDLESTIDKKAFEESVDLLSKAEHVNFFATGGSAAVALDAYHKFMRLGIPVFFDQNNHLSLIRLNQQSKNDVVILISRTGESREVLECATVAKKRGAKVIGITSFSRSTLASVCDICLCSSSHSSTFDLDSMISRLLQLEILDILYLQTKNRLAPKSSDKVLESRQVLLMTKKTNDSKLK